MQVGLLPEVIQELATAVHHSDQPTQRALVLLVLLHVGREVGDAHGALCDLYLGRPGVFLMESVPATAQVTCSGDGVVGS